MVLGSFETVDRRLMRLRTEIGRTIEDMGKTVAQGVDVEARRRSSFDAMMRFRQVEQRQQPAVRPFDPRALVDPNLFPGGIPELEPAPFVARPGPFSEFVPEVIEAADLPRQKVGVPVARGILEEAATAVEAGQAVSPARIPGAPSIRGVTEPPVTPEELRSPLATELLSFVTDPLNIIFFPGTTVRLATKALTVGRLTAAESRAIQALLPRIQGLRASTAKLTRDIVDDALRGVSEVGEAGGRVRPPTGGDPLFRPVVTGQADVEAALRQTEAISGLPLEPEIVTPIRPRGQTFRATPAEIEGAFPPEAEVAMEFRQLLGAAEPKLVATAGIRNEIATLEAQIARGVKPRVRLTKEKRIRQLNQLLGEPARDVHIAKADPSGAPPRRPPSVKGGASPDDPQFDAILESAIKGEKPDATLMRRHQGVIDRRASQLNNEVTDNNRELVRVGLGQNFRGSVVAKTEGSFDELNSLLHNPSAVAKGDRVVPEELRPIYDKLRAQTDFEQAARVDFNPDQALVEDYFFRGWKPPEGLFTGSGQRGALGRNPAFKLPRVNATYDEMVEAGFKPMFENPAEQARYSQLMGVKYREQSRLIAKMQASEMTLPVKGGPVPEGWRVPQVGPAFEGKPYANGSGGVNFTRRWAVSDSMANRLENIYGKTPQLGKGEIFGKTVDFQKVVDALTFIPKRAKLVLSVFQHLDFLSRSHIGAWTGFADAIRRGEPATAVTHLAKWPKSAVDIVHSTFSPGARARLAKLGVDPKPLWKDRQISNLMLRDEGLSLRDPTLGIDLDDVIRQVKQEPKIVKLGKAPIRALDALERQWRQGLFQGTYPSAILSDVKNNIGPMLLRQHPEATDRQLAGMIAEAANKLYSVIPESQSVIQNKQARWFLTRFLFSLGENEGLLRSFTGAIRGPNAALFRTRLVGTYLGLMTLAGTIHFASTGKPLPLDRFVPVSKDKFGPLPFGYNTDFASPTLPIKGRGGVDIELDLVMQQDTIFRILDPKSFLNARFSVPVSSIRNQVAGTDFFGAPIDTVGPGGIFSRTSQLVQDLFAPIGAGQAGLEIFRNNVEESEGLITPGEGRLGTTGLGIQAGGVNLRAENTPQLLDRIRSEVLRDRGIEDSYATIAAEDPPLKQEIDDEVEERIGGELEIRGETSQLRGQQTPQSQGFDALEATRERQQVEQLADDTHLNLPAGHPDKWEGDVWRKTYADRQRGFFASREQIKEDFGITFDDKAAPSGSVKAATDAYFDINVDNFNLPDGTVDWDAFFNAREAALAPLSFTDRRRVVEWLRKFDTPTVTEFRKAQNVVDRFFNTPKYKGLSLEQGKEVDRVLLELAPALQTRFQAETGEVLSRRDAVRHLAAVIRDKQAREFLLEHFGGGIQAGLRRIGGGGGLRRITDVRREIDEIRNEERDQILIDNEQIIVRFYPDVLERELSREQEAGLLPSTLESLFGPTMTLPDIGRRGLRRITAPR